MGSVRIIASTQDPDNEKVLKNAIEESRLEAVEHKKKYQADTLRWRDRKVKIKNIAPNHLVLRRVANPDTARKLQAKWEDQVPTDLKTWKEMTFQYHGIPTNSKDIMSSRQASKPFFLMKGFLTGPKM